jgi:hypothetical protein
MNENKKREFNYNDFSKLEKTQHEWGRKGMRIGYWWESPSERDR